MGSYNVAEVCELTELLMFNQFSKTFDKDNIGISVFKNHNGCKYGKVRKEMIGSFKQHHLNLEIKCNLKTVDYFDKMFDLTKGQQYYSICVSILSILKEIPKLASKLISSNSCNEHVFNAVATFYNNILDKCGNSEKLTLEKEQETHERRKRGRNII